MILQNFTFPRAIALLDEIPYPPEKIAFLDLETKAYGIICIGNFFCIILIF